MAGKPTLQTLWPPATKTSWSMEADGVAFVTGELAGTARMEVTLTKLVKVGGTVYESADLITFLKGELSRMHVKYPYAIAFQVVGMVEASWIGRAKGEGRSRTGDSAIASGASGAASSAGAA